MTNYPAPLDKLLTLGEPRLNNWPNYPERFGLGPEHVADLIRMATDPELNLADPNERRGLGAGCTPGEPWDNSEPNRPSSRCYGC